MFETEYYPDEIAHSLCTLTGENKEAEASATDALCHLKTLCENPYNSDYFRVFYRVLEHCSIQIDNMEAQ